MKTLIIISFFCCLFLVSSAQQNIPGQYTLNVNLQGANFNSLSLRDYSDSHSTIIPSKSIGKFKWQFLISDSIVESSQYMELIVPDRDTLQNGYHSIRFRKRIGNVDNFIANIGVQSKENLIEAKYIKSNLFKNENIASIMGKSDTTISGNLIVDDFELSPPEDNSDIAVRSIDPYYAWFNKDTISYNSQLANYVNLAKSYPDSRYLITYLSLNLTRFKTREDVNKIYTHLSGEHKQSQWAKRIENYLSNNLENLTLINLKSNKREKVVLDSSKYNLLIFSASWCGPCIAEMPLLKSLHEKLNKKVSFTTVSMDYEKKVKAFQLILNENRNDWRVLYAFRDLERVSDLFSVGSIPLTILVYPNGRMERIDVRDPLVQGRLFNLLN